MRTSRHKMQHGLTLIELMVTIAIIGILAGIAWPLFDAQQMRQRRSEAVMTLTRIEQNLTDYFSDNLTYAGYVINPAITANLRYYTAAVNVTASTYTITMTPAGQQANDADCTTITLNHLGQKGYTGAAASAAACWGGAT